MKANLIYPLLIVIASSSYGILSTIVKLAMQAGFTTEKRLQVSIYLALYLRSYYLS